MGEVLGEEHDNFKRRSCFGVAMLAPWQSRPRRAGCNFRQLPNLVRRTDICISLSTSLIIFNVHSSPERVRILGLASRQLTEIVLIGNTIHRESPKRRLNGKYGSVHLTQNIIVSQALISRVLLIVMAMHVRYILLKLVDNTDGLVYMRVAQ